MVDADGVGEMDGAGDGEGDGERRGEENVAEYPGDHEVPG